MRCGLIGKIASKPDYVAIDAPRDFLAAFEPWLHAAVSSSRLQLGERWRAAFLAAPIWRFWLGAEVCGATIIGALMPSIDLGGRYFPLAAFAAPDAGLAIAPPEFDDHRAWFEAAEALLLATLSPGAVFEQAVAALGHLVPPDAFSAGPTAFAGGPRRRRPDRSARRQAPSADFRTAAPRRLGDGLFEPQFLVDDGALVSGLRRSPSGSCRTRRCFPPC